MAQSGGLELRARGEDPQKFILEWDGESSRDMACMAREEMRTDYVHGRCRCEVMPSHRETCINTDVGVWVHMLCAHTFPGSVL